MMKFTKHRNCLGCKAYQEDIVSCSLGYQTELHPSLIENGLHFLCPKELCPKPLTMKDFCDCNTFYNKHLKMSER